MAQGGLRPGEAMALRRQDVGANGVVHVQGSQGRLGRGPTKNPYSVRKVSVLHPVIEDRPVWRPVDAGNATRLALTPGAEARLWPTIHQTRLDRTWRRVLKTAGIRYRKPLALRHSFASILLSRGANLLAIQKAGGWRSAQVLLQTYAHYMADQETAAASSDASRDLTERRSEAVNLTW
jgi:integrase